MFANSYVHRKKVQTASIIWWWPLFKSRSFFFTLRSAHLCLYDFVEPLRKFCMQHSCVCTQPKNLFYLKTHRLTCRNEPEFRFWRKAKWRKNAHVCVCVSFPLPCWLKRNSNLSRKKICCILANSNEWINNVDGNNYYAQLPKNSFNKIPGLIMLVGFNKIQHISRMKYAWYAPQSMWRKQQQRNKWKKKKNGEQCACVCARLNGMFLFARAFALTEFVGFCSKWRCIECANGSEQSASAHWKKERMRVKAKDQGTKGRPRDNEWEKTNDKPSNN